MAFPRVLSKLLAPQISMAFPKVAFATVKHAKDLCFAGIDGIQGNIVGLRSSSSLMSRTRLPGQVEADKMLMERHRPFIYASGLFLGPVLVCRKQLFPFAKRSYCEIF